MIMVLWFLMGTEHAGGFSTIIKMGYYDLLSNNTMVRRINYIVLATC